MAGVTLKDVARECGVSFMTVSNVMNGRTQKVSEKTILTVLETAKRLNYVPNAQARSLVSKKSHLIAVIILQTEQHAHHLLENPFYSEFVGGVEETARLNGYSIILRAVGSDAVDLSNTVLSWNVDGAIVLGVLGDELYTAMKQLSVPVLLVDSYIGDEGLYRFNIDDEAGARLAVDFLIDRGHRNIAFVSGTIQGEGVVAQRYRGYKKALRERGIDYECVIEGEISFEHGVQAAQRIIETDGISAVFAMADILAAGLLSGFHKHGKNVANDYSVIGFDDTYFARITAPPLTTVNQNIANRGRRAVEILLETFDEKPGSNTGSKQFYSPLVISERDSVRSI